MIEPTMIEPTTAVLLRASQYAPKVLPADLATYVTAMFKSRAMAAVVTGLPFTEDRPEVKAARALLAMPLPADTEASGRPAAGAREDPT